jgi:hypothetical protein
MKCALRSLKGEDSSLTKANVILSTQRNWFALLKFLMLLFCGETEEETLNTFDALNIDGMLIQ